MNRIAKTLVVALSIVAGGCANTYQIRVDSIAETGAPRGTRYVLVSGMADVTETDLYFKEFAAHFRPILAAKGFSEVASRDAADFEVALSYGTSSGRAEYYTYTRPIYHVTGGEQIRYREIRTDASGQKTETSGTFYVPVRTEVIGYTSELNSQTVYTSYVILDATTRGVDDGASQRKPLWKTTLRLTDPSNDLRQLIPHMAAAGAPYVATNTGASIKIERPKNEPVTATTPKADAGASK
jgi:hypothetical protein